jgi:AcrR family transcriptional regulator
VPSTDRTTTSPGPRRLRERAAVVDGRRTRWDSHRAERRAQVVEAALEVLGEVGPEFGVEEVAERAGVTKPVIYRHFTDRAGLVAAMGEWATASLLDDWVLPVIHTADPPRTRIRGAIAAFLGFLEQNPNVYWLFVRHAPADGSDVAQANKDLIGAAVAGVLHEFLAVGGADPRTADVWAHGLVGFVQNTAEWWLEHRTLTRDELADHLTTLVWAQMDGVVRSYGLTLDPDEPITPDELAELARRRGLLPRERS